MARTSIAPITSSAGVAPNMIRSSKINSIIPSTKIEPSESDDQKTSTASLESPENQKAPRVKAVSPTSSLRLDIRDTLSTTFDERAKRIEAISDKSGNLIDDLDCDDSSTSSMTTIIDSEQSSSAHTYDDLENTFRSGDEVESDSLDDDDKSVDPLHSSCFVVFGDEFEGRRVCSTDGAKKTTNVQITRPKTSKINPMTGEKSLTDDMQEWKTNVLSSWTLEPKKKRKYTKRPRNKRKSTTGQHSYPLRCKTKTTKHAAVAVTNNILQPFAQSLRRKKCRELQNIADFNRPGMTEECNVRSLQSNISEIQGHGVTKKEAPTTRTISSAINSNNSNNKSSSPRPSKPRIGKIERRITRDYSRKQSIKGRLRTRPILPGRTKGKKADVKPSATKRKGQKIKRLDSIATSRMQPPKRSKKKHEGISNVSIGNTRVAKRFIFNQLRRKGQDKTRIFFGTVSGKYSDKDSNGECTDVWHIVFDDGDEQYFDNLELKKALELYTNSKHRDKKNLDDGDKLSEMVHFSSQSKKRSESLEASSRSFQSERHPSDDDSIKVIEVVDLTVDAIDIVEILE